MSDKLDRYDERAEELLRLQTRDVALREGDVATYPERCRAQRHHDVICIMLKEITRANAAAGCMNVNGDVVFQQAKAMADLAYPPATAYPPLPDEGT